MRHVLKMTSLAALLLSSAIAPAVLAQSSGGTYVIDRVVIAGGGSPMSGGSYQLSGTFGQAATSTLSALPYLAFDGFWTPVSLALSDRIFADGFE
jgi:hypothetical protein